MKNPFFLLFNFGLVLILYCNAKSVIASNKLPLTKFAQLLNSVDVKLYQIKLRVEPNQKFISGLNQITYKALNNIQQLPLKLKNPMVLDSVIVNNRACKWNIHENEIVIILNQIIRKGELAVFTCYFHGNPPIAKNAPWDGGFVFEKDNNGYDWVGLACEGIGSSSWLPSKDTWDDEPESMIFSLQVPDSLVGVSNGVLVQQKLLPNHFKEFTWKVNNPINHYNISVNIGRYVNINDVYKSATNGQLNLSYYVLEYNADKARTHFQQVKRMLACFEKFAGAYPFWEDGYKLVETPYWGMEHQSCIAYGNDYKYNEFGFDFIVIHESGHEWFANSITAKNRNDIWIHESFTTYMETLFVECMFGKGRANEYILTQKGNIKNKYPMCAAPGENKIANDNDVYYKGAWILHTLRQIVNNDSLWFNAFYDYATFFKHKLITTADVSSFFSKRLRRNLTPFFKTYLYQSKLPVFEYYLTTKDNILSLHYRLQNANKKLNLPVKVTLGIDRYDFVTAENNWQIIDLPYFDKSNFKVDALMLVEPKLIERN